MNIYIEDITPKSPPPPRQHRITIELFDNELAAATRAVGATESSLFFDTLYDALIRAEGTL